MPGRPFSGVHPSTAPPLRALADSRPGVAYVWVGGELDAFSVPRLERVLSPLAADGRADVVLDMEALSFIDTAAVGLIARWSRRLRDQGKRLSLVRPPVTLELVAALTGEWADLNIEERPPAYVPLAQVIDIRLGPVPQG